MSFRSFTRRAPKQQRPCRLASRQVGRWVLQTHQPPIRRPAMIRMTRLPEEVTRLLAPLKPSFSYRHYLVCCWLLVAHLVCFGKATVQGLARYTPRHMAAWHLRRVLAARRWPWARVLEWLVSETLA